MRTMVLAVALVAAIGGAAWYVADSLTGSDKSVSDQAHLAVTLPAELTARQRQGGALFAEYCSACHGDNAAGSDNGPPLIHKIYEPGHHGDASFFRAASVGVRSHHWRYGDMPPVEGISEAKVASIVSYVRAVQRANGIR